MRPYTGQLRGVIFDWSGTTVDCGCFAPTMVFVEAFQSRGVEITIEEARRPMGRFKRDHIQAIMQMPEVSERWRSVHGRLPNDDDMQMLYEDFIPRQMKTIADYSDPIPGVVETVADLRARGLKIGSCTGYTREMMEALLPVVRAKGYAPTHWLLAIKCLPVVPLPGCALRTQCGWTYIPCKHWLRWETPSPTLRKVLMRVCGRLL